MELYKLGIKLCAHKMKYCAFESWRVHQMRERHPDVVLKRTPRGA